MSQEFQGGVCGGNWWMINSSQNFFRTSPCSSSIDDFGWPNHNLHVKNLQSLSYENNPRILQEDANFLNPIMNNYSQQIHEFTTFQESSFDSVKNQPFIANHNEQTLNSIVSSSSEMDATHNLPLHSASYGYDASILLQNLFDDTDSDQTQHEHLSNNLGSSYYTQVMNSQMGSFSLCAASIEGSLGELKESDINHPQFSNKYTQDYRRASTAISCDVGASVLSSTQVPQFVASTFNKAKTKLSGTKHRNQEKKAINQPTTKRPRIETPPLPTFKVRKEKLGDRITALQQLVSPFGKTDTASVLHEAIDYIKFLHDQVKVLSTPYMKNGSLPVQYQQKGDNNHNGFKQDLKSRGLCVVPISSTFPVTTETSADFWTPNFGGSFK